MGTCVVYILKSAICMAVFYLFYKLLLTRDTFHRLNRITLLGCMALSCLIPLVHYTVEQPMLVNQPMLELEDFVLMNAGYAEVVTEQAAPVPFNWFTVVVLVYVLGAVAFLIYHAWSVVSMLSLLRKCTVQEISGNYKLVIHNQTLPPFSWMRYIIISQQDLDENASVFLEHEKAHISCKHSYDLLLATLFTIVQWFNPAAWLLKKELQSIHEYEADDRVLNGGIDAKTYQILLIKKAAGGRLYTLANSFNHSSLKKRIAMMLKTKSSAWARLKYAFVLPVSVLAITAFARPEVVNLSQEMEAVTVEELTATVSKVTEKVSTPHIQEVEKVLQAPTDTVYQVVDEQPEFPGGVSELMKFLATNMKYPSAAQQAGKQGRVIVQFVIDKEGKAKDGNVIRSVDPSLDAEALRIINAMPAWTPGKLNGKVVAVRYTLPVTFTLQGSTIQPDTEKGDIVVQSAVPNTTEDDVFQVVENQPEFPGGATALMEFLAKNMKYPEQAAKEGKGGRVIVQFIIDKDGSVKNAKVVRSVDPLLDAEALRVLSIMPNWEPGKQKGVAVKVRYTLPVSFKPTKDGETSAGNKAQINVTPTDDKNTMVNGTVHDAQTKEPLVGASIFIIGTTTGTITDLDGTFRIPVEKDQKVQIGYPGYKSFTLPIKGKTTATIYLEKE